MTRIPRNTKPKVFDTSSLKKIKKMNPVKERTIKGPSKLERTPSKTYFDYSTEENGYFTRRDAQGRVLEVFELMFRR